MIRGIEMRAALLTLALLITAGCAASNAKVPPTGTVYARLAQVQLLSTYQEEEVRIAERGRPRFVLVFEVAGRREAYAVDSPAKVFHGSYDIGEWYKLSRMPSGDRWRIFIQQKGRGL